MLVKLDHFPKDRGKNCKTCLKPPPKLYIYIIYPGSPTTIFFMLVHEPLFFIVRVCHHPKRTTHFFNVFSWSSKKTLHFSKKAPQPLMNSPSVTSKAAGGEDCAPSSALGGWLNQPIPLRVNSKFAPENWWLEDKPFLFGMAYFQAQSVYANRGIWKICSSGWK